MFIILQPNPLCRLFSFLSSKKYSLVKNLLASRHYFLICPSTSINFSLLLLFVPFFSPTGFFICLVPSICLLTALISLLSHIPPRAYIGFSGFLFLLSDFHLGGGGSPRTVACTLALLILCSKSLVTIIVLIIFFVLQVKLLSFFSNKISGVLMEQLTDEVVIQDAKRRTRQGIKSMGRHGSQAWIVIYLYL